MGRVLFELAAQMRHMDPQAAASPEVGGAAHLGEQLRVADQPASIWTARLVHVGNLGAQALAEKVATPEPTSVLDWPELRVRAVIPQPYEPPLVLLYVGWPKQPPRAATLLVALDEGDTRSLSLLSQWCSRRASIAPVRRQGAELELRRRQSLERVHAVMVAEDIHGTRC